MYNLKYGVPIETKSCLSLLSSIICSNVCDDEFMHRSSAAELIFDVERFFPVKKYEEEKYEARQKLLKKIENESILYNPDNISWFMDSDNENEKKTFDSILKDISPIYSENISDIAFVLSNDPFYTQQFICHLDPNNTDATLGILATAGIEFCLPAIYCKDRETLEKIKEKYEEERLDYLDYLTKHLQEIHIDIVNGDSNIVDLYKFVSRKVAPELKIRAKKFEVAVSKADEKTKRKILIRFNDMIPRIGSALASGQGIKASVAEAVLSAFCGSLFESEAAYREMRVKHPEAAYIYNLKKELRLP